MGVGHDHGCCTPSPADNKPFAKALKIALALNLVMFVVESVAGFFASSVSLQADAVDFLGDSINYASSLYVLSLHPKWASRLAFFKGVAMAVFGIAVLGYAGYRLLHPQLPDAALLGSIGFLALMVNAGVAVLLYRFHEGDSNQQSVWICSRNDAIGNALVIFSGILVFVWQSAIPDIIAAVLIASLALKGAFHVIMLALRELKTHSR